MGELADRIVDNALTAARAHQQGRTKLVMGTGNRQTIDLSTGGYCARFVRQIVEVSKRTGKLDENGNELYGVPAMSWEFRRANARLMERALRDAGLYKGRTLDNAAPGDIVGINKPPWVSVGHIAIYVGEVDGVPCIAENTSVAGRGNPRVKGTKLTPWAAVAKRVTGIYRLGRD
jgi:hypothetical protein